MIPETWLSARMTIPGLIYFLGIFFFVLWCFEIRDLKLLESFKDYGPYIAVVVFVLSYVLGSLANTILVAAGQLLNSTKSNPVMEVEWMLTASERLMEAVDARYSYMLFTRSSFFAIVFCGISFTLWSCRISSKLSLFALIATIILGVVSFCAWQSLKDQYNKFRNTARQEMMKNQLKQQ